MIIDELNEHVACSDAAVASGGRRAYDSPRRREQARATRAQIVAAARRLFATRGWAGTRVRDVAREAGVAEPTVYAAYGSTTGIARALVESVETSADAAQQECELRSATGDPAAQLAAMISFDRRLFEHGGDVVAILRDAGPAQPDLHAAYQDGRARADQLRHDVFTRWPSQAFRDGIRPTTAIDTYAALCNIDVYRVLTQERGYTPDQVEHWWQDALTQLLLR